MSKKSIISYLSELEDKRRGAGRRHDQTLAILLVLMGAMSGYNGYRAIGDFIERNRKELLQTFKPHKDRLPTFFTIRRVLQNIAFSELNDKFSKWANQHTSIKRSEWISIDGKAIAGSMTDYHEDKQRFVNLVSLYCSKQGLVIGTGLVDNSKQSELPVVRDLIAALDIKGVVFTLDALHCQKKP